MATVRDRTMARVRDRASMAMVKARARMAKSYPAS